MLKHIFWSMLYLANAVILTGYLSRLWDHDINLSKMDQTFLLLIVIMVLIARGSTHFYNLFVSLKGDK